ncbi:MAG: antitoxin family protein [Planctomycetes bacterium]|nr:antitoxin family protein [Planctomycetota bacterium]
MTRTINAVYENGLLRPLQPLDGLAEHAQVKLTIETVTPAGNGLTDCIGILPDEDAAEMRQIVESEFEQVNLSDW